MIARGYQFDIIQDIGSGINYNKKGLNQLLDRITNGEIEIIDNTEKTEEQELVEDLIPIVTVFSCRLQGKRANKAKKMIKELMEDDASQESKTTPD